MRMLKLYALMTFILAAPNYTVAGWEVASPGPAGPVTPREPFFQSKVQHSTSTIPVHSFRPPPHAQPVPHEVPLPSSPLPHVSVSVPQNLIPNQTSLGQPRGVYAVSISGSLKENIERIMSRYHWRVIWKAPYDYNFDGRIIGKSLPNVIDKLLKPFPLHAVMYMSNRTLAITSRPRYK